MKIPPRGNKNATIIFVGEMPTYADAARRITLAGQQGQLLSKLLGQVPLSEVNCYFTYVIKESDLPLIHYFKNNKFTDAGMECALAVQDEVFSMQAKVIILLGAVALKAITDLNGIEQWRGSVLGIRNKFVIPTMPPDRALPPKSVTTDKFLIVHDIRRAVELAQGRCKNDKYEAKLRPSVLECCEFIDNCEKQGMCGFDIEIAGDGLDKQLTAISLAFKFSDIVFGISIPFVYYDDNKYVSYFCFGDELFILGKICSLLENPNVVKVGQNLVFDTGFMYRRYGVVTQNIDDTLVASKILMGDYPANLGFITSIWTTVPYYKKEGKLQTNEVSTAQERFWLYSAKDAIVCLIAYEKMVKQLISQGNFASYRKQCDQIPALVFMTENGIRVDTNRMRLLGKELEKKTEDELHDLLLVIKSKTNDSQYNNKFCGSSKQLKSYFWGVLGLQKYKTLQKKDGFDDVVLTRYERNGIVEATHIRKIREWKKLRSTYCSLDKVDPDGRMRSVFSPQGTKFSRLSSSSSLYGTGMNVQNWPHELLGMLAADEDYVAYEIDLSQAENRIVAYLSGDPTLIAAFESGIDIHSLTGSLLCLYITGVKKSIDEIKEEDTLGVLCVLGGTWRKNGKRANHGLNYNLTYKMAAMRWAIQEKLAKTIVDAYHMGYPRIRQVFHRQVQSELLSKRALINLLGRKKTFYSDIDQSAFNEGYSYIPQSTVGDILINAITVVYNNCPDVVLLLQKHDSLAFQLPLNISFADHADQLRTIVKALECPLVYKGYNFYIPADIRMAKTLNFDEGVKISRQFDSIELAEKAVKVLKGAA